jgi:hypothetical protein
MLVFASWSGFLLFCCNLDSIVQCCNSYPNPRSWKLSLYKEKLDSNFAVFLQMRRTRRRCRFLHLGFGISVALFDVK